VNKNKDCLDSRITAFAIVAVAAVAATAALRGKVDQKDLFGFTTSAFKAGR
ncbi:Uncharacterized protein APZ42_005406, partial [Daphnia magna]